jgi:hypothetical protein
MESSYSVELGSEDAVLELPWSDPAGQVRFVDTAADPTLVAEIPELQNNPELLDFLIRANDRSSGFTSAKCDVWSTEELEYEDVIFNASTKLGGYVDLVFTDERRYSFEAHERFARDFTKRVRMSDDIGATSELIVRRLYEQSTAENPGEPRPNAKPRAGAGRHTMRKHDDAFYFTLYTFGFGSEEAEARGNWAHALKIVADALFG